MARRGKQVREPFTSENNGRHAAVNSGSGRFNHPCGRPSLGTVVEPVGAFIPDDYEIPFRDAVGRFK
jgi:hypothetical protein